MHFVPFMSLLFLHVWNISSNENKNQFSQIIAFICVKTKVYNDPSKRFFLHGLPLFTKYKKLKWTILSYKDTVTSAKGILRTNSHKKYWQCGGWVQNLCLYVLLTSLTLFSHQFWTIKAILVIKAFVNLSHRCLKHNNT